MTRDYPNQGDLARAAATIDAARNPGLEFVVHELVPDDGKGYVMPKILPGVILLGPETARRMNLDRAVYGTGSVPLKRLEK